MRQRALAHVQLGGDPSACPDGGASKAKFAPISPRVVYGARPHDFPATDPYKVTLEDGAAIKLVW